MSSPHRKKQHPLRLIGRGGIRGTTNLRSAFAAGEPRRETSYPGYRSGADPLPARRFRAALAGDIGGVAGRIRVLFPHVLGGISNPRSTGRGVPQTLAAPRRAGQTRHATVSADGRRADASGGYRDEGRHAWRQRPATRSLLSALFAPTRPTAPRLLSRAARPPSRHRRTTAARPSRPRFRRVPSWPPQDRWR